MINKYLAYLIAIVVLAGFLRFYNLGSYPALNADEAALGYNAYSLLQTGKDEHGNAWPLHFQSFNDYKPGIYVYLTIPSVALFGLNEWAVRLPGAFAGVGTVILIYLLVKVLFKTRKLALLASLLLAINPWHIHFSRGAWEVNVATFFITLGLMLFIKSKLKNLTLLVLAAVSFVLSLYTYHAARVVVPLLGMGLVFLYKDSIRPNLKPLFLAGFVSLILLFPLMRDLAMGQVLSRSAGVGLFADVGPIERIHEQRGEHLEVDSIAAKVLHNKPVNYGLAFLENWTEHFHGQFLFLSGEEIQRNRVPETGQMYLFELLTIILGMVMIFKKTKSWGIVLWWLAIAPVAAALTFQSPHALRSQNMVIPLTIISAYGLYTIFLNLDKLPIVYKKLGQITVLTVLFVSLVIYLHMYYVHMAKAYPFSSQYGVKELVPFINTHEPEYSSVVVTTQYDQPYILFLFYMKYPPKQFQEDHVLTAQDKFGFSTVNSFGKYVFKQININSDQLLYTNTLFAGTPIEMQGEDKKHEIRGTNNYKYFEIVTN